MKLPLEPNDSIKRAELNCGSAAWPINPAFSRNPKPPALAGGVFTGQVNAVGTVLAPEHTLDQAMQFNQHAGQR